MVITNSYLENVANAMTGNTYVIPSYISVATTTVSSIATNASVLLGEIGTRVPITSTSNGNTITHTAIRTPAFVIDTINGDDIEAVGLNSGLTGNNLQEGLVVSGITQTTNFNVEHQVDIVAVRE